MEDVCLTLQRWLRSLTCIFQQLPVKLKPDSLLGRAVMRSFIHSFSQRRLKGSSFSITSERVVREHLGLHQLL